MASCDNYELPNPPGQTNPDPEQVFTDSDIDIVKVGEAYNLKAINDSAKNVVLAKVAELKNFPQGYTLEVDAVVGSDANFTNSTTVTTSIAENNEISVIPALLNGAIQEVMTKAPGTYDVNIEFIAYAVRENTRARLGGIDKVYAKAPYKVTTFTDKVIEQTYYLVHNGTCYKMNNTMGTDVNAYDQPEFAVVLNVPESAVTDGYSFNIIPESAYNNGNPDMSQAFGCIANTDRSGKLAVGEAAGKINIFGPVMVVINAETDAYNIAKALDTLYILSGRTTSVPSEAMTLESTNSINFNGVAVLKKGYYICGQPSYKNDGDLVFYQDNSEEPVNTDEKGTITRSGLLTSNKNDGSQLQATLPSNALYYMDVHRVAMTYSITEINTMSVIGGGNDWDLTTATPLVASSDLKVWKTEGKVHLKGAFKINCNGDWVADFGSAGQPLSGETGTLQTAISYKGGDIDVEEGDYNVTVNFSEHPYTVTLTK